MWPRDHRVKSAKCCGHKSCRSGDRSILIFNVRKRIHMTILLQSVTIQLQSTAKNFYYKMWQIVTTKYVMYYKEWQTVITKCVRYYKVWQTLLQSAWGIPKCNGYYKVRRNTPELVFQNQLFVDGQQSICSWIIHKNSLNKTCVGVSFQRKFRSSC